MSTTYQVSDMMIGVRNMIEAADLRQGDQVLLLADTRSDKSAIEALTAGLRFFGAHPMTLVTEPISRYGDVPQAVLDAMHASDVVVWVWPVFITFTPAYRAMGRKREESGSQLHEERMKPYHIYFEGNAGLLTRDYAKFPNKVLWKLAEKVREVVSVGKVVRIEDSLGTNLTATYDARDSTACSFALAIRPAAVIFPGAAAACSTATGNRTAKFI